MTAETAGLTTGLSLLLVGCVLLWLGDGEAGPVKLFWGHAGLALACIGGVVAGITAEIEDGEGR